MKDVDVIEKLQSLFKALLPQKSLRLLEDLSITCNKVNGTTLNVIVVGLKSKEDLQELRKCCSTLNELDGFQIVFNVYEKESSLEELKAAKEVWDTIIQHIISGVPITGIHTIARQTSMGLTKLIKERT